VTTARRGHTEKAPVPPLTARCICCQCAIIPGARFGLRGRVTTRCPKCAEHEKWRIDVYEFSDAPASCLAAFCSQCGKMVDVCANTSAISRERGLSVDLWQKRELEIRIVTREQARSELTSCKHVIWKQRRPQ